MHCIHPAGCLSVGYWLVSFHLFGALSNAEVAGLLADTGGEYVYYKKIYNRFFSFIFGWSLFAVIQTASISSLAYIFAQSLNSMIHLPPLFESLARFQYCRSLLSISKFHRQDRRNPAYRFTNVDQ